MPYVDRIGAMLAALIRDPSSAGCRGALAEILNGQPSREIRRLVRLDDLRVAGAFFTGKTLAQRALSLIAGTISRDSVILDPACGVGDLLLGSVAHLPVKSNFHSTLESWGSRIMGRDVFPAFTRAAKVRIALAALSRGVAIESSTLLNIEDMLPGIESRCGVTDCFAFQKASHIFMNPPFTLVDAPQDCRWASGKVNCAAIFLDACVLHARPGTRIVAILPDVLRSGSRYEKWRKLIQSGTLVQRIDVYGRFDQWTDVDVFIMSAEVTRDCAKVRFNWQRPKCAAANTLQDLFHISVGAVVPHRDPHKGRWYPFACSRNLAPWATVKEISEHRRFLGRTFNPPFVAVRRTSSPSDSHRPVACVVAGKDPIAVENHLLVLQPKNKSVTLCHALLEMLSTEKTSRWLNKRIRCRHLTVSALREFPWSGPE